MSSSVGAVADFIRLHSALSAALFVVGGVTLVLDYDKHWVLPRDTLFFENDPRIANPNLFDTVPSWFVIFFAYFLYLPVFFGVSQLASRGFSLRYVGSVDKVANYASSGAAGGGAATTSPFSSSSSAAQQQQRTQSHQTLNILSVPPTLLYYWLAVAITHCVTCFAKIYVGRKRPNFLSACDYDFTAAAAAGRRPFYPGSSLVKGDAKHCRGDPVGGMLSFPSGHSSLAFASAVFVALELSGRVFSQAALLLIATFIACSRVVDFKHHTEDIIAGAALGAAISAMVHTRMIRSYFATTSANYLFGPSTTSFGSPEPGPRGIAASNKRSPSTGPGGEGVAASPRMME